MRKKTSKNPSQNFHLKKKKKMLITTNPTKPVKTGLRNLSSQRFNHNATEIQSRPHKHRIICTMPNKNEYETQETNTDSFHYRLRVVRFDERIINVPAKVGEEKIILLTRSVSVQNSANTLITF